MTRSTVLSNARTTTALSTAEQAPSPIPVQGSACEDAPVPTGEHEHTETVRVPDFEPVEPEDLGLDEDPDTSLVGSIYLHLLSEHSCYEALRLGDDDAIDLHRQMHSTQGQNHGVQDWRFRPGRALAASMLGTEAAPPTPEP